MVYYDPIIELYLEAYEAQLISGTFDEQASAAAMLRRASAFEIIEQYVKKGATLLGENVTLEANLDIDLDALANDETYSESGDLKNIGGAIIATNDVTIRAGEYIINQFIALEQKLRAGADDGCGAASCGYRTNFHPGEILAGGDIILQAGLDIQNQASHIGAAGNVVAIAGRDIINTLQNDNYGGSRRGWYQTGCYSDPPQNVFRNAQVGVTTIVVSG